MPLAGSLKSLLLRGLLAGLIAGLLTGAVAFALGEPHVAAAIAIEESTSAPAEPHDAATPAHSHDDDPLVSRDGQRAGLFLATTLAGIAIGAIFGVVAHYARRFTTLSGPLLVLGLAGAGWLAVEAVPFFKYPANPPAVGDPDTINERTWLWLAALVLGLFAVCAAVYVAKVLVSQRYWTVRLAASALTFLAIVTVGYLLLPTVNEVGEDFPATLLWEFRISSMATQATLWLCLGLAFAFLTERAQATPTPERISPAAEGKATTRTTRP
ncbi:putative cobalt transporter CbtA [Rhodococcus sp. OK519]|uniref:CbtA family protein n=1 Tax=Rhodococcus sp. OK519 TaxID=2135729 RepID=UPI000D386EF1|nr:putative cobalt transporter CbtA [Rhodococcus sp. OK519]